MKTKQILNQEKANSLLDFLLRRLYPAAHELNPETGHMFKRRNLVLKTFALIQSDRIIDGRFPEWYSVTSHKSRGGRWNGHHI